jgi:predicted nuclease of predicted toxin-antitoxin system
VKLLIDENLSPSLVQRLGAIGVAAEHVAHIGKSGLSDPEVWELALERDATVATINARDYLRLAASSSVHAGLIILRSQGLDREAQWAWLEPPVQHLLASGVELVNRVVVVTAPEAFTIRDLPPG